MITTKVFLQIIMALYVSKDPAVNTHLCSALRENKNYTLMMQQCESSQTEFSCYELYKTKCEVQK